MANTFRLKIISLDGVIFNDNVQSIMCRAIDGDLAIMAGHSNYITAVGMGTARIVHADGSERTAACIGGSLSMIDGECSLIVTTWEWSDEIDTARAETARKKAEKVLENSNVDEREYKMAVAKLQRALVRLNTAK